MSQTPDNEVERASVEPGQDPRDAAVETLIKSNLNLEAKYKELKPMLAQTVKKFGFVISKSKKDPKQLTIEKDPEFTPQLQKAKSQPAESDEVNQKDIKIKQLNIKAHHQQKKMAQLKHDIAYFDNSLLKDPINIQN